ncbi:MAG: hypothetical protein R3A13_09105 [Bdellovibrionota bacterium]
MPDDRQIFESLNVDLRATPKELEDRFPGVGKRVEACKELLERQKHAAELHEKT